MRYLLLTLCLSTLIFSGDISDGNSVGGATVDALISFVVLGSGNLLYVAFANGWRPGITRLTPVRAWAALAVVAPVLLFVILAERSGIERALILLPVLVAAPVLWLVTNRRRHAGGN